MASSLPSLEADILACGCVSARRRRNFLGPALKLDVRVTAAPAGTYILLESKQQPDGKFTVLDRSYPPLENAESHAELVMAHAEFVAAGPPGPTLKLSVCAFGLFGASTIGTATCTLGELLAHPSITLLVQNAAGLPVVAGDAPPIPCELTITPDPGSLPTKSWPWPTPPPYEGRSFPKHVFLMTRGTRGDVQPFVALAVGMATRCGWLVTLCTELAWKGFVLQVDARPSVRHPPHTA